MEISGGTFLGNGYVTPLIYGGVVIIKEPGTQGVAEVVRSHATVTGGTFESGGLDGGYARSDNETRAEALAEENTATFTGGNFSDYTFSMTGG